MFISVFSDEFYKDAYEVFPIIKEWGMEYVDFRGLVNGKGIEFQTKEELVDLKGRLDDIGLKVGVIQSSLAKVHLPDKERQAAEMVKLEGIIRAADILDCRMVRSFNFWQQEPDSPKFGEMAMRPDELGKVLEMFHPFEKRAKEAGLILGFENCGQTPDEVIALLNALNVPGWGLAWDVFNYFDIYSKEEPDCTQYFTKALKYANMIHVKCSSVLPEIDDVKVPWDRVISGAATLNRNIPVSVETHVPPKSNFETIDTTRRVYEHIKKVWPSSAPADLKTALATRVEFVRPYADNPVRIVVVGLGQGKYRCSQMVKTSGIRLYGVCDTNFEKAKEVGEMYQVPYSDDINTFLQDGEVEAMYILTPTGLHCEIAKRCMEAGKHVFLTKPIDANVDNCMEAINLANEKGLLFGVDFDLHYEKELAEVKAAIDAGWFGKVLSASTNLNILRTQEYYEENGSWRGTWKLDGGGALSNQGIHEIDRLITLFGTPEKVRTFITNQTHEIEAEDFGVTQWKYDNGMVVRLSSTTSYPASSWYARVEIYGTEGAYLLTTGGPEGDHVYWWKDGRWSENAPYPFKKTWQQGSDNFAYCLRTGEPLLVDYEQGILSRLVLDKMYESAKSDEKWIDV
jgi:predicted dehydrogenase/sugar phosphate isomerase/epimerase